MPAAPTLPDRPASTDPLDVFNHHKAHLPATHEFLRRFTDERDTAEAIRMAESAPLLIPLAEQMLEDFEAHMPKPLSNFERTNPEARELRLATSDSFIEGRYLLRSRQRLVSLKSDILRAVANDVEWLSSSHATIRYAPAAMTRIEERFHALDRIAPGDEEVAERRNALMPVALQAYQGLSALVADARMPARQYSSDDRTALERTMKELYEARYPGRTVLRVVITSEDWREQAAAEIRDDRIVAGVYRYIQAALAATSGADPATVYTLGFRRTWSGRGDDFGPPELHSIGGSYPILSAHLTP